MLLKLKDVSKFYYSKGVIATGFRKVNLNFELNEFVVITGESGSGKSTLLNVISGLDSYQEGEMYINDEETSHYREEDYFLYRKKYVSNIFQTFNLINSYSVYQNIELVLLLNGYKKKEVKNKVLELIKKVGLSKFKNTKVSKLSGGQKQRVAIARALAKETPIIVCDEPTGNLDSKASKEIIKLLKDISEDKLIIMVTHNFKEVEDVATRVINMHDGKIISDKKKNIVKEKETFVNDIKGIGLFNSIKLGLRNTINIIPKFLLILFVFFFISISLLSEYGTSKEEEYNASLSGYNYYFNDLQDTRVVINKIDRSTISLEDVHNIEKMTNVSKVVYNDLILDEYLWFSDKDYDLSFSGMLRSIDEFDMDLDYGRMPKEENEVILYVDSDDYYFSYRIEDMLSRDFYFEGSSDQEKLKIVGVKYNESNSYYVNTYVYCQQELINKFIKLVNKNYSTYQIKINNKFYEFSFLPSNKVKKGEAYIYDELSYTCQNYECKNKDLSIEISNIYYSDTLNLKIKDTYNEKNANKLLGINQDDYNFVAIYINQDDYNSLYDKESYQSSVIVSDINQIDLVCKKLNDMGYNTLQIRKSLNQEGADLVKILKIFKLILTIILLLVLFFISYVVIKLILKSRNKYFSTLRILGANNKEIKRILDIELFIDASISYLIVLCLFMLVKFNYINILKLNSIVSYIKIIDYFLVYLVLIIMSYLISTRYSRKIFKNSAMESYREEV